MRQYLIICAVIGSIAAILAFNHNPNRQEIDDSFIERLCPELRLSVDESAAGAIDEILCNDVGEYNGGFSQGE